jgi:hypothetical protein
MAAASCRSRPPFDGESFASSGGQSGTTGSEGIAARMMRPKDRVRDCVRKCEATDQVHRGLCGSRAGMNGCVGCARQGRALL